MKWKEKTKKQKAWAVIRTIVLCTLAIILTVIVIKTTLFVVDKASAEVVTGENPGYINYSATRIAQVSKMKANEETSEPLIFYTDQYDTMDIQIRGSNGQSYITNDGPPHISIKSGIPDDDGAEAITQIKIKNNTSYTITALYISQYTAIEDYDTGKIIAINGRITIFTEIANGKEETVNIYSGEVGKVTITQIRIYLENSNGEWGAGYEEGYKNGNADGYNSGYNRGQEVGYNAGYTQGKEAGYNQGYKDGTEGNEITYSWLVSIANELFDTKVFGTFTLGNLVFTMLAISVFGGLLKLFFGG